MPKEQRFVNGLKASEDEWQFSQRLDSLGIKYDFDCRQPYPLIKGFKGNLKNWRDTTYTPDFAFFLNGIEFFIEIKGFMRAENSLKHKLFDLYITKKTINARFFVLKYKGSIKDGTKGFYDYSYTNFKTDKNIKEKEFFHRLGKEMKND